MSNFEQSYSEGHRGNISTQTRKGVFDTVVNGISSEESQKAADERLKERVDKFGRNSARISEVRNIGIEDRLAAKAYDEHKYLDEYDQRNYHEGFFTMGNRAIHGNLEKLSDNELNAIGANDYVSGVDINSLPEAVRNNISYAQGYMMATIFGQDNKKSRR